MHKMYKYAEVEDRDQALSLPSNYFINCAKEYWPVSNSSFNWCSFKVGDKGLDLFRLTVV